MADRGVAMAWVMFFSVCLSPIPTHMIHIYKQPSPPPQESAEAKAQAQFRERRADQAARVRRAALEEAVQVGERGIYIDIYMCVYVFVRVELCVFIAGLGLVFIDRHP